MGDPLALMFLRSGGEFISDRLHGAHQPMNLKSVTLTEHHKRIHCHGFAAGDNHRIDVNLLDPLIL